MKKFIVDTGKKKYRVKANDAKRAVELVKTIDKEVKDSMIVYDKNFFGEFNGFEAGLFSKMANSAISQIKEHPKGSAERKELADYYIKNYKTRLNEARKQVDEYSKEYNNELVAARAELQKGQNLLKQILSAL